MKHYLADTNILLRYLLDDIPTQADIVEDFFRQAKIGKITITIPFLVFVELDFVLTKVYKFLKLQVIEKMKYIAEIGYLDIEKRNLILEVLYLYESSNLSFVDLLFYLEAKNTGKELLTFDRKLAGLKYSTEDRLHWHPLHKLRR